MRTLRLTVVLVTLAALFVPAVAHAVPGAGRAPSAVASSLNAALDWAARSRHVPRDLLAAVAYNETHFDSHNGEPSVSGGYGVMHLVSNPATRTLERAIALTGQDRRTLQRDTAANLLGGAALLRSLADDMGLNTTDDPGGWYQAVARYSNAGDPAVARLYADTVYTTLATGLTADAAGEKITIPARAVTADRGRYARAADLTDPATDYPATHWAAADSRNYSTTGRSAIDRIVIHVTQGSYAGAIAWFQNPVAKVSAHYVVRSRDGAITQMVRNENVAWHAGNRTYNTRSIGIEHEGYTSRATWFTDAMYRASAALTSYLCDKYGIPKDRQHIIGHSQVPGATHTDPGRYWDWNRYLSYLTGGWSTVVDNANPERFTASANWGASAYSTRRRGADYRYAKPGAAGDLAWFRAAIPKPGTYRIEVWYPSLPGYNPATPFVIATAKGSKRVTVNQSTGGGRWRGLGSFRLSAGERKVVGVSRWSSRTGYMIADAVRISRQP